MAFKKERSKNKFSRSALARGFTLFELLVSIAIFTIMTTVILVNNNSFKGTILTTNLAYEIALATRQAQVYGVDTNGYTLSTLSPTAFQHAFGVHFDAPGQDSVCSSGTAAASVFCLFGDVNDNNVYDPSVGQDVLVEKYVISAGNSILDFCAIATSNGNTYCSDGQTTYPSAQATPLTSMDVAFLRPDPTAIINACESSCGGSETPMTSATITVESSTGTVRVVSVSAIGQISVVGQY